ncbi:MAG: hypothetical protein KJP00_11990, partial [Bacteroidia bacterium]|nr:hypothetical protein [Bacteroidia bacterium]
MRLRHILVLLSAFCISVSGYGQTTRHKSCGHDDIQVKAFESKEAYEDFQNRYKEEAIPKFLKSDNRKNTSLLSLPVVVH